MSRKVAVVITARASYARIKSALAAIRGHNDLELFVVVAASALLDRYGNAVDVIARDGFKADARVYMIVEGENLVTSAKSTGMGLAELATVFDNLRPDLVVTIADRFETIATAVAAAYMNIPLVHVQGGEVTGSIDEKVRHAVTKLADIHLVASESARARVIRMGEKPDCVFNVGCPSIDLAAEVAARPEFDFDPFEKYVGVGAPIDLSRGYVVAMQHPVTTEFEQSRKQVAETLHAVARIDLPTLWFWPNVDAGSDGTSKEIRSFREIHAPRSLHFFKNMEPEDFLRLAVNSRCVVGNSSVGIRECSFLGVPVVNIGTRQRGRDRGGNVIDVPHERETIRGAIEQQIAHGHYTPDHVFGDGGAGPRIANVLATVPLTFEKRLTF
ncbi:MAG: UDP-N-acetylglucosamine 2-epimerase (hydrolyzing) [Xanthobacteraceae bacterium]|nr:UDP-N-acetylglucosamine 2-epimerase (hydrolyzing) [Xanthobacteraceae bacterium]